jgi:hypothetical protein
MHYYCTYFDRHYLVRALALHRSLTRHAEPFRMYALCMDDESYEAIDQLGLPDLVPISLQAFEEGDEALLAAKQNRSRLDYYFTCTPSITLYILDKFPEIDVLTYLDADLFFYDSPAPIFAELGDQSILIVAHRFPPSLRSRERFGIYNVGLLSFRNDASGRECLTWWRERCLEWCHDRAEDGRFADQKYLDDWPTRFKGVAVLQHRGAGLAPWNVSGSELREEAGIALVDNQPLIFFHFHNFKRLTPYIAESGLKEYGARMGSVLRRRVYAPYLRELQVLEREADVRDFRILERQSLVRGGKPDRGAPPSQPRTLAKSWARKTLLLLAGWVSISSCLLSRTGVVVFGRIPLVRLRSDGVPGQQRFR